MKKLIVFIAVTFIGFVGFGQVLEITFKDHIYFNSGSVHTYEEMIKDENMVVKKLKFAATNKYIIDFDNKLITMYYNGLLIGSETITNHYTEKDLLHIEFDDIEHSTGKRSPSFVVINQNKDNSKFPYFTYYFISTVTNTSNGCISQ